MSKSAVYFEIKKLTNLTTEISMIKIQQGVRIEASEYDHEHVCFEVDARSCAQGQLVKIEGIIFFPSENMKFDALGKVKSIVPLESAKVKITIELRSHDKDIWGRFVGVLKERQAKIDKLFASMRGEE